MMQATLGWHIYFTLNTNQIKSLILKNSKSTVVPGKKDHGLVINFSLQDPPFNTF